MNTRTLSDLLASALGLDASVLGQGFLSSVAVAVCREAGISDLEDYLRAVVRDEALWRSLVERVVVSETWFFRDAAAFAYLAAFARARPKTAGTPPLRILSAPCATGEEAYSAAICLLETGLPPEAFSIEALDVHHRALDTARSAVYRAHSLRTPTTPAQARYLTPTADSTWQVKPVARASVQFRQANMLQPLTFASECGFDIIFCRNLLVYLLPAARTALLTALTRVLAPGGRLLVGPAEAGILREFGLRSTGDPAAFAFSLERRAAVTVPAPPVAETPPATTPARAGIGLAEIRSLGDAGELPAALRLCTSYLQATPQSVEALFLLGTLQEAVGMAMAATQSFRRVLYLEPSHGEALLHLALKHEAQGDHPGAARLRARHPDRVNSRVAAK